MSRKMVVKMTVDLLTAVLFLTALAQPATGNFSHEIIGVALGALFVWHNALNAGWYRGLLKGRYGARRIGCACVNLLLAAAMLALLVSGVMISRDLFSFLPVGGGWTARQVHTCTAYWGLILMGVHIGLHGEMISRVLPVRASVRRGLGYAVLAAALYGVKASFDWHVGDKLFMQSAFTDWSSVTAGGFLVGHAALLALYALAAYYAARLLAGPAQD